MIPSETKDTDKLQRQSSSERIDINLFHMGWYSWNFLNKWIEKSACSLLSLSSASSSLLTTMKRSNPYRFEVNSKSSGLIN